MALNGIGKFVRQRSASWVLVNSSFPNLEKKIMSLYVLKNLIGELNDDDVLEC